MINNLNYYNVFYMVAKTGSISRAANQLYISQPAVSKAISNLEESIGIALFVRNSRGVALTEEGTILYDYIERALDNIVKGEESLKKYNELGIGHIRIGVSTSLCKHILLDYLKPFIKDNPNIKVSIDCHSTKNTIRLLKNEEIDIGLICETELPKNITYSHVRSIHDIFVANSDYIDNFPYRETEAGLEAGEETADTQPEAANYPVFSGSIIGNLIPLMNVQQSVSDSEVLTEDHIRDIFRHSTLMMLEEANVTRTHVDNYLNEHSFHCNQLLEINNMDLLLDFAAIGMGIASVVREFSEGYLKDGRIVEIPLPTPIPKRSVGFAYLQNRHQSKALCTFLDYCNIS